MASSKAYAPPARWAALAAAAVRTARVQAAEPASTAMGAVEVLPLGMTVTSDNAARPARRPSVPVGPSGPAVRRVRPGRVAGDVVARCPVGGQGGGRAGRASGGLLPFATVGGPWDCADRVGSDA
ncbi:hypothetical protein GCM10018781_22330 [Kitasatospora indigofera]|uniref:Secreted protein n=1 Tax=Kitasatospora indigofera TaxID=67307 RepID=A0A919FJQ6_9ACTN|nr:hypothetical protein GCM10018781_22330 [Kitasatospora indigofera]